ncbi:MAG: cytidine deaminase [Bacillota bacterium]
MKAETVLAAARSALYRAYAPYSGFPVGAAILTTDGALFTGSNIENASYAVTICAERNALYSAVHAGHSSFERIAVFADSPFPVKPCGSCRQALWELAGDLEVITANLQGETCFYSLGELLPHPFGGSSWENNPVRKDAAAIDEEWRVAVSVYPVGYVSSDYPSIRSIPEHYKELTSRVIVNPDLEEGLYRLDEEKELNIISYLHKAEGYNLKDKRSGRNNEIYGVFACRTPFRPNALALSRGELIAVNNNVLTVRGLDLINGTPVIDIKTVMPPKER